MNSKAGQGSLVLASHQPNFLPYMGFFYKVSKSDLLVFSEDVTYSKKGMHNWNRIYTSAGPKKLTVPVNAHHDDALIDVRVSEPKYHLLKLAKTIEQEYRKAPHFNEGMELVELMLKMANVDDLGMTDLNIALSMHCLSRFGIKVKTLRSTIDLNISGHKDERMFQMCEQTGADVYMSGTGAKAYHQDWEYLQRGIELVYSDYKPVVYPQIHGDFVENLSVLDYIFNQGYVLPKGWVNDNV